MKIPVIIVVFGLVLSSCGFGVDEPPLTLLCALTMDEECKVSTNPDHCLSKGLLDLNHPAYDGEPVYYLFPLVKKRSSDELVQINKATLSYEWLEGNDLLKRRDDLRPLLEFEDGGFDVYFRGVVSPDVEKVALKVHLRAIPPEIGSQLISLGVDAESFTLGVYLRVRSEGTDGALLYSNRLLFPIEFCWGCLSEVCPDGTYPACLPGQDGNIISCE